MSGEKAKTTTYSINHVSFFSRSGWEYNEATGKYYLHYFARNPPHLNGETPILREKVYKLILFWPDKGIDGFRIDVTGMN